MKSITMGPARLRSRNLARHDARCVEIEREDRQRRVAPAARGAAAVDVDHGRSRGVGDGERAAARQRNAGLQRGGDVAGDAVILEERRCAAMEREPLDERRRALRRPPPRLTQGRGIVDDDGVGHSRGKFRQHTGEERRRRLEQRRRRCHAPCCRDRRKAPAERIEIGGKLRRCCAGGWPERAQSLVGPRQRRELGRDAAAVGGRKRIDDDAGARRRQREKAAFETEAEAHACPLVGARRLQHLHQHRFAFRERGKGALGRIFGAEKGGPLETDFDQRGRELRLQRDDATQEHLARLGARRLAPDAQSRERSPFDKRRPNLARRYLKEERCRHRATGSRRWARTKPWPASKATVSASGKPTTLG